MQIALMAWHENLYAIIWQSYCLVKLFSYCPFSDHNLPSMKFEVLDSIPVKLEGSVLDASIKQKDALSGESALDPKMARLSLPGIQIMRRMFLVLNYRINFTSSMIYLSANSVG